MKRKKPRVEQSRQSTAALCLQSAASAPEQQASGSVESFASQDIGDYHVAEDQLFDRIAENIEQAAEVYRGFTEVQREGRAFRLHHQAPSLLNTIAHAGKYSDEKFKQICVARNEPAIFDGAVAVEDPGRWRPSELASALRGRNIKLRHLFSRQEVDEDAGQYFEDMLREAADVDAPPGDISYLSDLNVADAAPDLDAGITVPGCLASDSPENLFSQLGGRVRPVHRLACAGPRLAHVGLHTEACGTYTWKATVHGRKLFMVWPEHKAAVLRENALLRDEIFSRLPPAYVPLEVFARCGVLPWIGVVRPGETIVVPGSCPHQVLDLDASVALGSSVLPLDRLPHALSRLQLDRQALAGDRTQAPLKKLVWLLANSVLREANARFKLPPPPPPPLRIPHAGPPPRNDVFSADAAFALLEFAASPSASRSALAAARAGSAPDPHPAPAPAPAPASASTTFALVPAEGSSLPPASASHPPTAPPSSTPAAPPPAEPPAASGEPAAAPAKPAEDQAMPDAPPAAEGEGAAPRTPPQPTAGQAPPSPISPEPLVKREPMEVDGKPAEEPKVEESKDEEKEKTAPAQPAAVEREAQREPQPAEQQPASSSSSSPPAAAQEKDSAAEKSAETAPAEKPVEKTAEKAAEAAAVAEPMALDRPPSPAARPAQAPAGHAADEDGGAWRERLRRWAGLALQALREIIQEEGEYRPHLVKDWEERAAGDLQPAPAFAASHALRTLAFATAAGEGAPGPSSSSAPAAAASSSAEAGPSGIGSSKPAGPGLLAAVTAGRWAGGERLQCHACECEIFNSHVHCLECGHEEQRSHGRRRGAARPGQRRRPAARQRRRRPGDSSAAEAEAEAGEEAGAGEEAAAPAADGEAASADAEAALAAAAAALANGPSSGGGGPSAAASSSSNAAAAAAAAAAAGEWDEERQVDLCIQCHRSFAVGSGRRVVPRSRVPAHHLRQHRTVCRARVPLARLTRAASDLSAVLALLQAGPFSAPATIRPSRAFPCEPWAPEAEAEEEPALSSRLWAELVAAGEIPAPGEEAEEEEAEEAEERPAERKRGRDRRAERERGRDWEPAAAGDDDEDDDDERNEAAAALRPQGNFGGRGTHQRRRGRQGGAVAAAGPAQPPATARTPSSSGGAKASGGAPSGSHKAGGGDKGAKAGPPKESHKKKEDGEGKRAGGAGAGAGGSKPPGGAPGGGLPPEMMDPSPEALRRLGLGLRVRNPPK